MFNVFIPQRNLTLQADLGKNLMDLLIEQHLPVASSCQGEGICSKCALDITPAGLPSPLEVSTLIKNKCEPHHRLSCQFLITEDITVKAGYW